jgi:Lrp/AsnC family transcriptional regulator, leucine-responsive regulatory protein
VIFCRDTLEIGDVWPFYAGNKIMDIDKIDTTILSELAINARASQVELAERVGLSSTAIARRQKVLEEEGFIRGYQAVLDLARFGLSTTVLVRVTLESQNEEALKSFEAAVIDCPSVVRCFLMSGSDDYIVIVMARDIEDFERIHRTELSRLPRVARIQSSFAMREVVNAAGSIGTRGTLGSAVQNPWGQLANFLHGHFRSSYASKSTRCTLTPR